MADAPRFPEDHVVVDVGMHAGEDSLYYARRGFRVIAVEANPELCAAAAETFARAGVAVEIRHGAVAAGEADTVPFYVNAFNSAWSSARRDLGDRRGAAREIAVPAIRLDRALAPFAGRIHFVKIDIEGHDRIALEQVLALPVPPPFLSVENGSLPMLEALRAAGYARFKFSNQRDVPLQTIPPGSPHGHVVDVAFSRGASGVFGEDLPGRWLSADEAIAVQTALAEARRLAPANLFAEAVGWFDLHAALG